MQPPLPDPAVLPPRIGQFREQYRQQIVGRFYNGYLHLMFVSLGSLAIIAVAVSQLGYDWRGNPLPILPTDWLTIPITLFIANVVEYIGHRGPMHHRRSLRFLSLLFHRHTDEHHQFFTDDWMTVRTPRDFKIVLFPPIMLLTYLGLVAFPAGLIGGLLINHNVAHLVVATSMFYFFSYEVLHFTYHIDENTLIGRNWMVRKLREHHRIHHDQKLMTRYNFNITWPVADLLFGTIYRGVTSPPAERSLQSDRGVMPQPASQNAPGEATVESPVSPMA